MIDGVRAIGAGGSLLALLGAIPAQAWTPMDLFSPCAGDCGVAVFTGPYIEDSMVDIFGDPIPPWAWDLTEDRFVGFAASRDVGSLWRISFEPEMGIGQRFGTQDETEFWGAVYFRYHGFPWDKYLVTTFALSTGLNWATGISDVEKDRARDGEGSQLMHYFAPEITFALPSRPDTELLFRIHHRSGVFGLISDAWGGAQYATVGLRVRF
jgi:hypothetical protein